MDYLLGGSLLVVLVDAILVVDKLHVAALLLLVDAVLVVPVVFVDVHFFVVHSDVVHFSFLLVY
jgi:hypothetical protein